MVKGPGLYTDIGKKAIVMCMPIQLDRDANSIGFQDVTEVIHNKVLIAAGVSGAIGQLLKPFTSVVFYGKNLDFRTALQVGGFPSTHSSGVRREVGKHARMLNKLTTTNARKVEEMSLKGNEKANTLQSDHINEEVYLPLKESIGPILRSTIFDE